MIGLETEFSVQAVCSFNPIMLQTCPQLIVSSSETWQAKVLEPLGAITSGSQFLEPDGNIYVYEHILAYFN